MFADDIAAVLVSIALEGDEEAKRVREWRHKLQKAFLTPKSPPKPEVSDHGVDLAGRILTLS